MASKTPSKESIESFLLCGATEPAVAGANNATTPHTDQPRRYTECKQHNWSLCAADAANKVLEKKGCNASVEASSSTERGSQPAVAGAATAAADAKATKFQDLPKHSTPYEETRATVENRQSHLLTYEDIQAMDMRYGRAGDDIKRAGNHVVRWIRALMEQPDASAPTYWVADISDAQLLEYVQSRKYEKDFLNAVPGEIRNHVGGCFYWDTNCPTRSFEWPKLVAHLVQNGNGIDMRVGDTVKHMEVRAFPNSKDHKRITQDRALMEWGVEHLPKGYRPIGGGVTCPEWYFILYLGRPSGDTEYLINPINNWNYEVIHMTPERRTAFRVVGDKKSGKSSDGRCTVDGDDENSPVGTPSLGESTVVDDEGNAAAVGRPTGEKQPTVVERPAQPDGQAVPPVPMPQRQMPGAPSQTLVRKPLDASAYYTAYGGKDHAVGNYRPDMEQQKKKQEPKWDDATWNAWNANKGQPKRTGQSDPNQWSNDEAKKGWNERGQHRYNQWSGGGWKSSSCRRWNQNEEDQ